MAFRNPLQSLSVDFADITGMLAAGQLGPGVVTGPAIAASAITADKISANAISADKIQAGAVDGTIITGAKIRTAAYGARWEMLTNGVLNALFGLTGDPDEGGPASITVYEDPGGFHLSIQGFGSLANSPKPPPAFELFMPHSGPTSALLSADTLNLFGKIVGQPYTVSGSTVAYPTTGGAIALPYGVTFTTAPYPAVSSGSGPMICAGVAISGTSGQAVLYDAAGVAITTGLRRVNWTVTGILA